MPATSNLSSRRGPLATTATQAIVTGGITVFSEPGGDLIIDLVGTKSRASGRMWR